MHYREFAPSAVLAEYIRCIWILEGAPDPDEVDAIFPDGSMELVFQYGSPMRRILHEGESYLQSQSMLIGQISKKISLQPTGKIGMIGIRFHPWGVFPLLPMPLHEITDREISLDLIWGSEIRELEDRIYHEPKEAAIEAIQHFLLRRLAGNNYTTSPIRKVIQAITCNQGNTRIDGLADQSNLSERQFNRKFSNLVGLSPKHFAGIIRFQHFFRQAQQQPGQSLGAIALSCGYYDQSHFIREFKQYAGMSPGEYFKTGNRLASLFLDI